MEREARVHGQQGAGEFSRGADPQDSPLKPRLSSWGRLGQAECKEWAGGSGDPPPTMALASPPQTGSGPAYQLTAATGGHPGHSHPCSPLCSDYFCHFPGLGRTRHSFKNISFAK